MPALKKKIVSIIIFVSVIFLNFSIAWSGTEFFLSTRFDAGPNSQSGAMFDLKNISSQPIILSGNFEGDFRTDFTDTYRSGEIQVWYRTGSYKGHEEDTSGWSLMGTAQVSWSGSGERKFYNIDSQLTIEPGETIGMFLYLYNSQGHVRMALTNVPDMSYGNSDLQIDAGVAKGKDTPAGSPPVNENEVSTIESQTWNGSIGYTIGTSIVPMLQLLLLGDQAPEKEKKTNTVPMLQLLLLGGN